MSVNIQVAINTKTKLYHLVEVDSVSGLIVYDLGALQADNQQDILSHLQLDTVASGFSS